MKKNIILKNDKKNNEVSSKINYFYLYIYHKKNLIKFLIIIILLIIIIKYFLLNLFNIAPLTEKNLINYSKLGNNKLIFKNTNQRKKIYVKFMDFWPGFNYHYFELFSILKERYEVIISENPDYIIYDKFGKEHYEIEKKCDCIKIFWNIENTVPNFKGSDYLIGLHYLFYGDRYFRRPTNTTILTKLGSIYNITQMNKKDFRKKKFCAWVVSNGDFIVRNNFFYKLSKYKVIDMGGDFKNNVGGKVKDKIKFLSNYKFSLSFENSKTDGYITEKLFQAFEAGTIPIYYGDDTILELINNRSYIHIRDENEFDEKIKLIKKIDQDDKLYQKIIKEKIVIDDEKYSKEEKKYKEYIYHIFDQEKEKAKRFVRK